MEATQSVGMADATSDVEQPETMADRLVLAFEMFEFGVEMMAATLRRRCPQASPHEIESMLVDWLGRQHAVDSQ